jgi:hypothetical protein
MADEPTIARVVEQILQGDGDFEELEFRKQKGGIAEEVEIVVFRGTDLRVNPPLNHACARQGRKKDPYGSTPMRSFSSKGLPK